MAGPHKLAAMFEAQFQSFEDRGERAANAPRLAALRAELKRRGLHTGAAALCGGGGQGDALIVRRPQS